MAGLLAGYACQGMGWATRPHVDTTLVQAARCMALGRRHQAERGSQYACQASHQLRAAHGSRCRMSEQGEGLEKTGAERCFGSLKGERTSLGHYATRQTAREDVVESIEMFYTSTR